MSKEKDFRNGDYWSYDSDIFWKLGNFDIRSHKFHVRIKQIILTGTFHKPSQK